MTSRLRRLLIVGASTRAAAWSALRAGFQPICADLYADADTRQMAEIVDVRNYPHSLPADVSLVQADAWMYTGALENQPELLQEISRHEPHIGPLVGCAPTCLRLIRDPVWVSDTLRAAGRRTLPVRSQTDPPPYDGTWLQKPLSSGGGRLIRRWDEAAQSVSYPEPSYFQRFISGTPMSAVFWSDPHEIRFLGATYQLLSHEICCASEPYAYCGSAGPVALDSAIEVEITTIARILVQESGMFGLFGIDFVQHENDIWPLEVNPRYTASIEILERSTHNSFFELYDRHVPERNLDVDTSASVPQLWFPGKPDRQPVRLAKLVMYAQEGFEVTDFQMFLAGGGPADETELADIPVPGSLIGAGHPICTVIGRGQSISTAINAAWSQGERLRQWMRISGDASPVLDRNGPPR